MKSINDGYISVTYTCDVIFNFQSMYSFTWFPHDLNVGHIEYTKSVCLGSNFKYSSKTYLCLMVINGIASCWGMGVWGNFNKYPKQTIEVYLRDINTHKKQTKKILISCQLIEGILI